MLSFSALRDNYDDINLKKPGTIMTGVDVSDNKENIYGMSKLNESLNKRSYGHIQDEGQGMIHVSDLRNNSTNVANDTFKMGCICMYLNVESLPLSNKVRYIYIYILPHTQKRKRE